MRKLKRCPFCGRKPNLFDFTIGRAEFINDPVAGIRCACGVATIPAKSRGYTVAVWNSRKSQPDREQCQECGIEPKIVINGSTGEVRYECPHCHNHAEWCGDEGDAADAWNRSQR